MNDILEDGAMADRDKSHCLDANYFKGGNLRHYYEKARRQVVFDKNGNIGCKQVGEADLKGYDIIRRVYSRQGKAPSLTTMQGGHREPKVECGEMYWRALTPLECERLQTVPDHYTKCGDFDDGLWLKQISKSQRYKMLGNGFTVDVISTILKGVSNET